MDWKHEFRIGNWVETYGHQRRVVEIGLYGILATSDDGQSACKFGNPALAPIPLTVDWVNKFKFGNKVRIQNKCLIYSRDMDDYWITIKAVSEILYVHHLQNLYFTLTGTELKLKSVGKEKV